MSERRILTGLLSAAPAFAPTALAARQIPAYAPALAASGPPPVGLPKLALVDPALAGYSMDGDGVIAATGAGYDPHALLMTQIPDALTAAGDGSWPTVEHEAVGAKLARPSGECATHWRGSHRHRALDLKFEHLPPEQSARNDRQGKER